ncbi:hypothetical protein ALP94_02307 [Pseudomonas savastanoi pv. glycinea]|nr:hypothetical protein ALP94_02307 [Pseudomonas savastanoi pv. glycinea]
MAVYQTSRHRGLALLVRSYSSVVCFATERYRDKAPFAASHQPNCTKKGAQ